MKTVAKAILSGSTRNFRKIKHFFTDHIPEFILLLVCLFLFFTNYSPNTWLIGWDNLLPEFDFKQDLTRNLFGVWAEYRGTGLLAGQAHPADLPRTLILYAIHSLGVPAHLLRYLWMFAMLYLGAIGTVRLFRYLLKSKFDSMTIQLAALLSGMFYLFNLSTLQLYFVPFDSFATFHGFLPWFILSFLIVLFGRLKLRSIIFLGITSLLISPSFFVYTLTIPLALYLFPFIIEQTTGRGRTVSKIKSLLVSILTVLSTQFYWLLPVIFFIFSGNVAMVASARINAISSPETLQRNLQFSGLNYVLQLKGYLFENLDLFGDKYAPLLGVWRDHLSQPAIIGIQILIILTTLVGFIYSLKQKLSHDRSLAAATLITIFFMVGAGLPFLNKVPLLSEALRSPFTKFSYSLALSYSLYFGIGSLFIMDLFSFLHHRFTYFLTAFTLGIAFVIFMTPAFTGNLISPSMRLKVPDEYFQLFDFFKSVDPATRVANFPQYTFWGWNYYSWGYRGSGFLWYGIKQPILDRAFDVWEKSSEKYYEEISTALYSEDQVEFENLIDKYAINWLLIDKNVIAPSENIDLGLAKLQRFLDNSDKFTLAKNIDDKIFVYKTNVDQNVKNFLSINSYSSVSSPRLGEDPAVISRGEVQPFANLSLRPIVPVIKDNQITLSYQLANDSEANAAKQITINIPSYSQTESLTPNAISYRKTATGFQLKFGPILPIIKLDGKDLTPMAAPLILDFALPLSESGLILDINEQYLEIQLPDELTTQSSFYPLNNLYLPSQKPIRISVYSNTPSQKLDLSTPLSQAVPVQCYTNKPNRRIEKIVAGKTISLFGTDLVGCLSTPIPPSGTNQLLSLEFSYRSATGTPANASITNRALGGENSPQALLPKSETTFTRIFAKPPLGPLQANLILEANESKSTQEITYQNPAVSYLPLLTESTFTLPPIPDKSISLSSPSSVEGDPAAAGEGVLSISLPLIDSPLTVSANPSLPNLNPEARNCDNFNTGKFDRLTSSDGFLYTSQNATSCDQLILKQLPHNTNYALLLDSKNQSGLAPTVCLENYATRRCDVFERLIDGPQLVIQPISNSHELPGYTLHLSNQSFGDRPTANLLKSLTITPIPYNFLKGITLSSPSNLEGDPATAGEGVINSNHPAEFLYTASVIARSDSDAAIHTTLNLYQTRSPYWKALEVSENDLKLPLWSLIAKLPLLYLKSLSSPSKLEGETLLRQGEGVSQWLNSWTIPPGDNHLIIFYLPQYLEFLGFFLLPLPFIAISIHILFIRKKASLKK